MHTLVVGRTNSGKTWICKKLAKRYKKKGYKIIVLDPMCDKEWEADYITDDVNEFLREFWGSQNCVVFVDESAQMIGRHNPEMERIAIQGRHFGHRIFFITQRGKQVSVNVRAQCSELICFKQSLDDTKDLANEFVDEKINQAHTLKKLEFIWHFDGDKGSIIGNVKDVK